ncbi:hypothetical protein [Phenylobacterium sp.]|jgi:hypothetical protein|uniref:hypothetical protein n=1 Tax=Phenylobacterium sp. TaxID=1871053 RepID=UPI002F3E69BD
MLKAGLLALALSALGAGAQAAPLFDAYQGFCLKTDADAAAGLSAATAAGWTPIPAAMMQQLSGAAGVENADGRMRSNAGGFDFMLVGVKTIPVAGLSLAVHFCALATTSAPATPNEASTALAGFAAMPPNPLMSKGGQTGYVYLDEGGVHKPITTPGDVASAKAMVQSGRLRFAFVQEGPTLSLLAYAVPSL